jgi:hypothetical protein
MRSTIIGMIALALISPRANAISVYSIAIVCKMDIEQYCKAIPKVRLRDLRECLGKHEKNLFPQCQDHYKEAR